MGEWVGGWVGGRRRTVFIQGLAEEEARIAFFLEGGLEVVKKMIDFL